MVYLLSYGPNDDVFELQIRKWIIKIKDANNSKNNDNNMTVR